MANQVKPFSVPFCIGYRTFINFDDIFEEEGTLYFDSPPKRGDTCVLCDGNTYEVLREPNDRMEITVAPFSPPPPA